MSILKIARMGHPALDSPARPIEDPGADDIRRLAADMAETLFEAGGVGLAAPQVHVPLRLVIFHVPPAEEAGDRYRESGLDEEDNGVPLTVLVNPQYKPLDGETESAWERCLSLPGMTGYVPRYRRVLYRGSGLDGKEVEREAEGFHARVIQHEMDHLDGVMYPMRMTDLSKFGFAEEMRGRQVAGRDDVEDSGEEDV